MSINALQAAQAYAQAASSTTQATGISSGPEKPDFNALVQTAIADTSTSLKAGEQAAAQVAVGEANLVDVVTAISSAEVSLETAIAVRNRMIEAYQEIMRMPI